MGQNHFHIFRIVLSNVKGNMVNIDVLLPSGLLVTLSLKYVRPLVLKASVLPFF